MEPELWIQSLRIVRMDGCFVPVRIRYTLSSIKILCASYAILKAACVVELFSTQGKECLCLHEMFHAALSKCNCHCTELLHTTTAMVRQFLTSFIHQY